MKWVIIKGVRYPFKIATAYFREQDLVPVFENSHCKLMKL